MNIPAGVVQYPKRKMSSLKAHFFTATDVFDGMAERPELQAYKEFLEMVQSQVLDMAHARSTDIPGKLKSSARRWSVQDDQGERQVCAVFAIGLIHHRRKHDEAVVFYDYDAIMNNGVQAMESPSRIRSSKASKKSIRVGEA
jgi:hypothetical protein